MLLAPVPGRTETAAANALIWQERQNSRPAVTHK
jgi:hypothetical protein